MSAPAKEFRSFDALMSRLLKVSKETLDARMAAYREQAAKNPNKRGPKPKAAKKR
jgi:putative sterol carrier protein